MDTPYDLSIVFAMATGGVRGQRAAVCGGHGSAMPRGSGRAPGIDLCVGYGGHPLAGRAKGMQGSRRPVVLAAQERRKLGATMDAR